MQKVKLEILDIKEEQPKSLVKSALRSKSASKRAIKVSFEEQAPIEVKTERPQIKTETPVKRPSKIRVKKEPEETSSKIKIEVVESPIEVERIQSTKDESLAEVDQTQKKKPKTLLGKRSRKERVKKFLDLEAEESEDEVKKEITDADFKNGKQKLRVCLKTYFLEFYTKEEL